MELEGAAATGGDCAQGRLEGDRNDIRRKTAWTSSVRQKPGSVAGAVARLPGALVCASGRRAGSSIAFVRHAGRSRRNPG